MSRISPPDEMEIVSNLLTEAIDRGYVTYDQILDALPEVEDYLPLLETILEELQAADILIYESEEAATGIEDTDDGLNGGIYADEEPHAAPLFDLSNVPIDDSVGLYFR